MNVQSAKITWDFGTKSRDKESTASRPTGLIRGARRITGEFVCYYDDTNTTGNAHLLGLANAGATYAMVLRLGPNTAGSRIKINIPKARIKVTPIELPEADAAIVKLSFVARMSSASNDESTIVFD